MLYRLLGHHSICLQQYLQQKRKLTRTMPGCKFERGRHSRIYWWSLPEVQWMPRFHEGQVMTGLKTFTAC